MNVKPAIHGRDHAPGGADPIVGWGGGIDFNKTNFLDASGADADYLYEKLIGTSSHMGEYLSDLTVGFHREDTGASQGWEEKFDGDGPMVWVNTGNGATSIGFPGPPAPITMPHGGNVGQFWGNDGHGAQWMSNTAGLTLIDNRSGGIVLYSSGSDADNVGVKLICAGDDFLVTDGSQKLLLIHDTGSGHTFHIPTGSSWAADL